MHYSRCAFQDNDDHDDDDEDSDDDEDMEDDVEEPQDEDDDSQEQEKQDIDDEGDDDEYETVSNGISKLVKNAHNSTRLHSSRMHTARSLTVSPSMLCSGGVPGPGGDAWSRGVSGQGGGIQACTEADPPVNRITHTCKNITLPQLRCGR